MHNYVNEPVLEELQIRKEFTRLRYAIENRHQPFIWSQLISATQEIESVAPTNLLKLLLTEEIYNAIDFSNIVPCNSNEIQPLITELREAVQYSKAIQIGFHYKNENKAPTFNANVFAKNFLSRVKVVVDKHGLLFTYSSEGVYKLLSDLEMGQLIRTLMNEGLPYSWKKRIEEEAIEAIKRECNSVAVMNSSKHYLNLKNGMYNFQTGLIENHHPDFFSTVQIPILYDSKASCPRFIQFMNEITCDDEQLIRVHQEKMGYLLSSDIHCQKAFIYSGWGANGKSVLAKIISILVGEENVSSISLSQFSSDFGLQAILGKTVNIASENETKRVPLNTEIFKAMVSGDGMTINRKHRSPLTNYQMKCKFLFLTNHLPNTNDYSDGYFRRLMIIPFKRTFSEAEQNPNLLEELKEELPGIFNWAMEGLKRLQLNGYRFSYSKTIENEEKEYKMSQQPVNYFFESRIELDGNSKVKRNELYDLYCHWHSENGLLEQVKRSRQKFYAELQTLIKGRNLNVQPVRTRGEDFFKGIKFKEVS